MGREIAVRDLVGEFVIIGLVENLDPLDVVFARIRMRDFLADRYIDDKGLARGNLIGTIDYRDVLFLLPIVYLKQRT
jgi:hypothetical protein